MAINVTTSQQQITASVAEDKISANVSAGFGATGPQGPSGVITVTAPITNAGTTTAANVGLSVGTGLTVSGGALVLGTHTHDDRYYTETEVDSLLSGYATLVGGKVPSSQLPSYVDDVIEVATYGDLPSPGESGKIYLVIDTNKVYRWTGFVWLEIVASPGSTDSLAEGSVNLYFTNVRAAAAAPVQSVAGKTGAVVLAAGDIASGTLSASRLPIAAAGTLGAVRIGSGISIDGDGIISASAGYTLPTATNSVLGGVKIGSGVTITDGVISVSTNYAAASHTHAISDVTDLATTLSGIDSAIGAKADAADFDQGVKTNDSVTFSGVSVDSLLYVGGDAEFVGAVDFTDADITGLTPGDIGAAAASHAHGAITSDGKVGSTSGLVLKTGASGAVEALAQGTAGQVLKVNSGATGVEWGAAAADVSIDTTAADILSASSGSITADDPGADRIVFWDDSAGKLTHLAAGAGLSISGTTIAAANAVVSPSQITGNQNDYAPSAGEIVRLSSDAARDITGIAAGSDGEVRVLVNVGSYTITLKHQSTSSTAANRFLVSFGADYLLAANAAAVALYDNTTARWRVI